MAHLLEYAKQSMAAVREELEEALKQEEEEDPGEFADGAQRTNQGGDTHHDEQPQLGFSKLAEAIGAGVTQIVEQANDYHAAASQSRAAAAASGGNAFSIGSAGLKQPAPPPLSATAGVAAPHHPQPPPMPQSRTNPLTGGPIILAGGSTAGSSSSSTAPVAGYAAPAAPASKSGGRGPLFSTSSAPLDTGGDEQVLANLRNLQGGGGDQAARPPALGTATSAPNTTSQREFSPKARPAVQQQHPNSAQIMTPSQLTPTLVPAGGAVDPGATTASAVASTAVGGVQELPVGPGVPRSAAAQNAGHLSPRSAAAGVGLAGKNPLQQQQLPGASATPTASSALSGATSQPPRPPLTPPLTTATSSTGSSAPAAMPPAPPTAAEQLTAAAAGRPLFGGPTTTPAPPSVNNPNPLPRPIPQHQQTPLAVAPTPPSTLVSAAQVSAQHPPPGTGGHGTAQQSLGVLAEHSTTTAAGALGAAAGSIKINPTSNQFFEQLQQFAGSAQQAISESVTQVQKQLQDPTQQLEQTIAAIKLTDHKAICGLDLQVYMQILLSMRILPEDHRTVFMEMLTQNDLGTPDLQREGLQYLLLYITKLNRKMKMMQADIQKVGQDYLLLQQNYKEAQEEVRNHQADEALRQELETAKMKVAKLEEVLREKEEQQGTSLNLLQQTFEDLTAEHDQTLRRLAAVREENEALKNKTTGGTNSTSGGGATASTSSAGNANHSSGVNSTLQRTINPKSPSSSNSKESTATPLHDNDSEAQQQQIDALQKQVKGLHRDLERLLREKEEHFFEKENFVDRRLVLSMASQLQSEPKPALKDKILAQMIEVLCVDETWKQLMPQRPVSTRNSRDDLGRGANGKPAPLSDALIDFVDREIEGAETGVVVGGSRSPGAGTGGGGPSVGAGGITPTGIAGSSAASSGNSNSAGSSPSFPAVPG
ncbi:unnamed protein product [Amoebophrya sp. A120]|nr:unnamed protein product [Amoebophrya sp. A120]|eukprot:GSA120T00009566001.1